MTPSSRPDPSPHRAQSSSRHGFTLVELLVVMGIILVLISILLPAVNRAHLQAVRTNMMSDFAVISQGLDAYRNDFGDYPRTGYGNTTKNSSVQVTGAAMLCWALVAPGPATQDGAGATTANGADYGGPGFRTHLFSQGKVYGPYISLDRFRIGTWGQVASSNQVTSVTPSATSMWDDTQMVLADRYGNIILYYPAKTNVQPTTGFVGSYNPGPSTPVASTLYTYNYGDNSAYTWPNSTQPVIGETTLSQKMFAYRLGDISGSSAAQSGDSPIVVPYLLWSAGPDNQFGPQVTASSTPTTTGEDDDVVYPDQLNTVPAGLSP